MNGTHPLPITADRGPPDGPVVDDVYNQRFIDAVANTSAEWKIVTPQWAAATLEKANTHNRRLTLSWQKIVKAIQRLAWWPNGEAIIFDRNGVLINGQHRLTAIVEAGKAVPCLVIYGVHPDAFVTFDQGKKRGTADVLSIEGYENVSTLAAAIGWRVAYDAKRLHQAGARALANDEVLEKAGQYPEIVESARFANANHTRLIPPGLVAFLHSEFHWYSEEQADEFFRKVIKAIGVEEPSWEHILRRRLDGLIGHRAEADLIQIAALVIKTWNGIRLGLPPKSVLVWTPSEKEPFPEIV